jgi:hypothetical protein
MACFVCQGVDGVLSSRQAVQCFVVRSALRAEWLLSAELQCCVLRMAVSLTTGSSAAVQLADSAPRQVTCT